jgi:hypothetical protein
MDKDSKCPLCSVYVQMRFLDSHVERARQNIKEMENLWDPRRVLQYYQEQLDYIDYCVKDISGKIMKYIQEGDFK